MLTNKKQAGRWLGLLLAACAMLLGGCKPPGARALLQGKQLLDKGQATAAIEPLQRATTLLPTNAHAWNYLGLACHAANQPNDAVQAYQKALMLNPNLVEAHYNFGCLLLEQGNPAAAKGELTAFVLSRPKDPNGWLRLAAAQWRTRDVGAAEQSFAEALQLDAKSPEALNGMGMIQLARNRPRDAAVFFSKVAKASPDYAPALLNLAILQHQYLGNRRAALEAYRDYLALKPTPAHAEPLTAIVQALEVELNPPAPPPATRPAPVVVAPTPKPAVATSSPPSVKPPPARPAIVEPPPPKTNLPVAPSPVLAEVKNNPPAVESKPPLVETFNATNEVVGKPPTNHVPPLPSTNQASASAPVTNPPAVSTSAPIVIAIVSNIPVRVNPPIVDTPQKPLSPAPRVIPRYPYHSLAKPKPGNRAESEVAFTQGLEAQRQKRLPDALAAFRAAVKADPAYFQARYNLAWTAYALKDWETALDAYEAALVIQPESTDARYNFALTLRQANYPLDAANELERVLAKRPDDAAAHLSLANLYAQHLGGAHMARPHYLKVLELQPKHPQATQIRYWLSENPL